MLNQRVLPTPAGASAADSKGGSGPSGMTRLLPRTLIEKERHTQAQEVFNDLLSPNYRQKHVD